MIWFNFAQVTYHQRGWYYRTPEQGWWNSVEIVRMMEIVRDHLHLRLPHP